MPPSRSPTPGGVDESLPGAKGTETPSQGPGRGELPEPLIRVQEDISLSAIDCLDHPRYHDPRASAWRSTPARPSPTIGSRIATAEWSGLRPPRGVNSTRDDAHRSLRSRSALHRECRGTSPTAPQRHRGVLDVRREQRSSGAAVRLFHALLSAPPIRKVRVPPPVGRAEASRSSSRRVASRAEPEGDICVPSNSRLVLEQMAHLDQDQLSRPALCGASWGATRGGI